MTELMEVPAEGGSPIRLLPPEDGVVTAAYSSDGQDMAIWTKKGLEILSLANGGRRIAVKLDAIEGSYIFRSWGTVGLAWRGASGEIAFSLLNKKTSESELWVVNQDGTDAKRVYSTKDGQIVVSGFLD